MTALWIGGSCVHKTSQLPVLEGIAFPLKKQVRSLEVLLDKHVTSVASSAFYQLHLVCQLWLYLD